MLLASESFVGLDILILGNLGIALVAGSAAALNHLIDSRIDARMDRTKDRPVAQGRVRPLQGAVFVGVTGSFLILGDDGTSDGDGNGMYGCVDGNGTFMGCDVEVSGTDGNCCVIALSTTEERCSF